jgi:hypothetical protein
MRARSSCWICRSLARMRLRIVVRRTVNRPSLFFPLICLEAQKIERLRFPFSSTFPVLFGKPAEFDPARLIRVKFQSKLGQSLA